MTFNDYQTQALSTDTYGGGVPDLVSHPSYIDKILGLVGESGEAADKFKKIIRDREGKVSEADRLELIKELGDVLWYIAVLGHYLGTDLESLAKKNVDKLADRHTRGVIKSAGDNR